MKIKSIVIWNKERAYGGKLILMFGDLNQINAFLETNNCSTSLKI